MTTSAPLAPPQTPQLPHAPRLLGANLICMASMALWAAGLPAADFIIPLLPGEQLAALRMMIAGLALLPLWLLVDGPRAVLRAPWARGIAVGSLIALGAWCIIAGQARSGPVTAAVISATMPVVGIGLEVVLDGRRLTRGLIVGLVLALIGGVMALDLAGGGLSLGLGAILCFGSVVFFIFGSRLTVTQLPGLSPVGRAALTVMGSGIVLLVVALLGGILGTPAPDFSLWQAQHWAALAIFAICALGLSQVLWIISVEKLGIGMSSLHINAAPFYVMLILFALGGGWDWAQAGGAALVGLGVLVAQGIIPLPRRQRPA